MPVLEAPVVQEIVKVEEPSREIDGICYDDLPDDGIREALEELATLELPSEDGIPLETNWHRIEMNLLIDSVHYHWRERSDYFAGGNMFIYFSTKQVRNQDYRGPDVFVVDQVDGTCDRDSWVIWNEEGRYPDLIIELASPSTIDIDLGEKKWLYEKTFHTQEYFCYDPEAERLSGWQLEHGRYIDLKPNEQGWLWSETLRLWLGIWQGEFQRVHARWLRFYTTEGQLSLVLAEAESQRAEAASQRAEEASQRAETETKRADAAEAEVERLKALLMKYEGK